MNTRRLCVGTGLVALDVILNGSPKTLPRLHTGGSCGNVLTILSFLGWDSFPIARLADNNATKQLENDLTHWKVKTDFITKSADGSTPIIIHRILKDKHGKPKHKFEFRDPDTGTWLPQYKPVLSKDVPSIIDRKKIRPQFFYFDRINRSSIELAKYFKQTGAVVFFEPSSIGPKFSLFEECISISDIVKFSAERIPNYSELFPKRKAMLEIETLGKDGLRFRFSKLKKENSWQSVKPYVASDVKDAAGAGDWCSAGIIARLSDRIDFKKTLVSDVKSAIAFGQALGAINCYFDGARGAMYILKATIVKQLALRTIKNEEVGIISYTAFPQDGKKVTISQLI